jgi:hypothetical protein
LERQSWLQSKAAGKSRFIWRQVLSSLIFWLILMPALDLLAFKSTPFSLSMILIDLAMLLVFLLEGYLRGGWKWDDLEKKFPA